MTGLVDGMGGEEVNQEVTSTAIVSGTNVYAASAVVGATISNADGLIKSVSIGSPSTFAGQVQAGTVATAAGSEGTIEFGTQFASKNYSVTFGTSGTDMSVAVPTVSGALNASGCLVIGDASTTYYFIAAGI